MSAMVRMRSQDHEVLRKLADATGESMSELLGRAVEDLRRKHFLYGMAEDFEALRVRESGSTWAEENEERDAWDSTLGDDLDNE